MGVIRFERWFCKVKLLGWCLFSLFCTYWIAFQQTASGWNPSRAGLSQTQLCLDWGQPEEKEEIFTFEKFLKLLLVCFVSLTGDQEQRSPGCCPWGSLLTIVWRLSSVLHDALQVLVELFWFHTQLQQGPIDFINHQNWFDFLSQSLSHDSFSVDGHTWRGGFGCDFTAFKDWRTAQLQTVNC